MVETKTQLPITRIGKISKIASDGQGISAEATRLLTFATEVYAKLLASEAHKWADVQSRKTILKRDIEKCIQRDWLFTILEDALDDWPDQTIQLQDPAVQDESGHEHVSANNSVVDVDEFHSGDEPEMEAQDDSAPVKDQDNGLAENNNAALHSIAIRDIEEAIS